MHIANQLHIMHIANQLHIMHIARDFQLGYKDSNLEMTESESVALPFGDSPISATKLII